MVGENIFVQLSGEQLDGAVLAGSHPVTAVLLCGMSGTGVFPLMVNSSGMGIFQQGSPSS